MLDHDAVQRCVNLVCFIVSQIRSLCSNMLPDSPIGNRLVGSTCNRAGPPILSNPVLPHVDDHLHRCPRCMLPCMNS